MTATQTAVVMVFVVFIYAGMAALVGGLTYRYVREMCPPEKANRHRNIGYEPHNTCDHGWTAGWTGVCWPIGWAFLLAQRIALAPTDTERLARLERDNAELERQLGITP